MKVISYPLAALILCSAVCLVAPSSLAQEGLDLSDYWNSPEFQKRFLGSYGTDSDVEPRFDKVEEREFYTELRPLIFDDPEGAIATLETFIKDDTSAVLDFTLGALYFQTGRVSQALERYEIATVKFPDFRRAHQNLGIALAQQSEFERCIPHLTKTIRLGGANSDVYGLLGNAYLNIERNAAAEIAFQNAILLDPDATDWKLGLFQTYSNRELYDDALGVLGDLIAENPESGKLWELQAKVYARMERVNEAIVNLEMMNRMGMETAQSLTLLGDLYMSTEAYAMAQPHYLKALESGNASTADRILRAAGVLTSIGDYGQARKLFRQVRALGSSALTAEQDSKLLKLEARVAMVEDRAEEAAAIMERIIERDPLDGEALLLAGDFYSANEETEKAMLRYETASKIQGFEAEGMAKMAFLNVQTGKYQEAVNLIEKAIQLDPKDNYKSFLEQVQRFVRATNS